jgi:hypothetical protein
LNQQLFFEKERSRARSRSKERAKENKSMSVDNTKRELCKKG